MMDSGASAATPGTASELAHLTWRLLAIELAIVATVLALLWPTTASLIDGWTNSGSTTYAHGFLIFAISIWLLVRNRAALMSHDKAKPSLLALVALPILGLLWLILVRASIQTGHQVLLPIILWCAIASVFGSRIALKRAFPIAYLYFGIPTWTLINSTLQGLTTQVNEVLLLSAGIPAFVEGNTVHLAAGVFEIAGGCSGLHYVIVSLALGALYGEVNNDSMVTRIKLIVLALSLALVANWVRVFIIIVAGYFTDMQHYLVRVDHINFGWMVFAVAMAIFFWIARSMPVVAASRRPETLGSPLDRSVIRSLGAMLMALSVAPAWNALARGATTEGSVSAEFPVPAAWSLQNSATSWQPQYVGADRQLMRRYVRSDTSVDVFVAEYLSQRQGHELIGSKNSLIDPAGEIVATRAVSQPVAAVESEVREGPFTYLVWHYYEIGGEHLVHDLQAQLAYGITSLSKATLSRIVALRTECQDDCAVARTRLSEFAHELPKRSTE